VRYENHGQAQLRFEVLEEIQQLSLDGHVERANRLISDKYLRPHSERSSHRDALALPAAQLARMLGRHARRQVHKLKELRDESVAIGRFRSLVDPTRLEKRLTHSESGVERGMRVLEYHLHSPTDIAEPASGGCANIEVPEHDRAGIGFNQSDQAPNYRSLAAPRFARNSKSFASDKIEGHIVNSGHSISPASTNPVSE
jgi:hypothetical protein